ncbi:putative splicing factor 3A subunit 1 [Porphyridium purpureum]|uniref:Putative splicing factor 3A subunit 1 n=1 Tax=Porphyridium purpureum TaxID=35688 RepID=A0A5J4YYE9_PORPP|nr:putative splicing factor 3A subunit 1 [Porphyridium purpureum]|eukprot:POR2615..scf209_3
MVTASTTPSLPEEDGKDGSPILPPPEIRTIIEKTVPFVRKNGLEFEAKVRAANASNVKFGFLDKSHPYHAFYQSRLHASEEDAEGRTTIEPPGHDADEALRARAPPDQDALVPPTGMMMGGTVTGMVEKRAQISKSRQALLEQSKTRPRTALDPPPVDVFSIPECSLVPTALELEVVKLTAQFTVCNPAAFLDVIRKKEQRNALFAFLQPLHPHHELFSKLCEAYRIIQTKDQTLVQRILRLLDSPEPVLDLMNQKMEWERHLHMERDDEEPSGASSGAEAGCTIDWHDFTTVETIDFEEDEHLPLPILSQDIARELQIRETAEAATVAQQNSEKPVDEDMDVDHHQTARGQENVAQDTGVAVSGQLVRLPTGQVVPLEDIARTMRAHLLDPKYKEERRIAADRRRIVNLVSGDEAAENLNRFSEARPRAIVQKNVNTANTPRRLSTNNVDPTPRTRSDAPLLPKRGVEDDRKEKLDDERRKKVPRVQHTSSPLGTDSAALNPKSGNDASRFVPEREWIARHGTLIKISVQAPTHENNEWKLTGQRISLELPLAVSVGDLKKTLTQLTKVPSNKQKLYAEPGGFLKDNQSLAYYNVVPDCVMTLSLKDPANFLQQHLDAETSVNKERSHRSGSNIGMDFAALDLCFWSASKAGVRNNSLKGQERQDQACALRML